MTDAEVIPTATVVTPWHILITKTGLIGLTIMFLLVSVRAYYGEYLFTKAELSPKVLTEYEQLLTKAWQNDPYNNSISLRFASRLVNEDKLDSTREVLGMSAAGNNHWQGWELEGMAWEKRAFNPNGTLKQARIAARLYDRLLAVHPTSIRGLERRAVLGLKLGEWELVDRMGAVIGSLDPMSNNDIYLRARAATGLANHKLAFELYSTLSAAGKPNTDSLYTLPEIKNRLKEEQAEADR